MTKVKACFRHLMLRHSFVIRKFVIRIYLRTLRKSNWNDAMTLPLANRTVALAEHRQLEELAQMLEKEGAIPLRCPMLSILDAPDDTPLLAWLDQLQAGA